MPSAFSNQEKQENARLATLERDQEALRESRRLLEKAQEVGCIGSWTSSVEPDRKVSWSAQTCRIFGLAPDAFDGRVETFLEIVLPEDRERVWAAGSEAIDHRGHYEVEYRIRRRDGEVRWIYEAADVERDPSGKPLRLVGVVQDITDRRAAEAAVRAGEQHIRHLNRVLGVLTDVNQAIIRLSQPTDLMAAVCRIGVERGEFPMVWLGVKGDLDEPVKIAAHFGASASTLEAIQSILRPAGCGCHFTLGALKQGEPCICNDIASDPLAAPWRSAALERGYLAMCSLPLRLRGEVIGCLNFYAREAGFFSESEIRLLSELAADIGFGLEVYERDLERARAEGALQQAHDRYRGLVHDVDGIVWEADPKTFRFLFVSGQAERLLGYPARQWTSDPTFWADHLHPDDRQRAIEYCLDCTARGESHDFEYRMLAADGRVVWLHDYVTVECRDGRPAKLRGLMLDITARRQKEAELRNEQTLNRTLLENLAGLFFVFSREGKMLRWNQALEEQLGESAETIRASHPLKFIAAEDQAAAAAAIARTFAEGRAHVELHLLVRGGEKAPHYFVARTIELDGERVLAGVGVDLRERRQAEAEIRRLAAFPEWDPNPVLEFSADGTLTYRNRASDELARTLGVADFTRLLPPDTSAIVRESLAHNQPRQWFETTHGETTLSWSFFPLRELNRVHAYVRDLTDRVRQERLTRRSQRLESIGTLAGGIAHDLNNTLTPILMGIQMFRADHPDASELADTIDHSARRAAGMVRQLLTFAKGADGRRLPLEARQLIQEMEPIIRGTFPKNLQLRIEIPEGLPAVLGDPTQLHQVLLNLCLNARDAMPDGGILTIGAGAVGFDEAGARRLFDARPGEFVVLRVVDTGGGIAPKDLDRIFDPFFTTKSPDKGSGLGLSTALGIVKGHGGFIHVASEPGRGATFEVYLPVADRSHAVAPPPMPSPESMLVGDGQVVLFVDDETAVARVADRLLRRMKCTPIIAHSAREGLAHVQRLGSQIAAIVTDLHMPGMDGLAFARAVREQFPDVPIVVASGRLDDPVAASFRALGVRLRLDKPFTSAQFSGLLGAVFNADPPDPSWVI